MSRSVRQILFDYQLNKCHADHEKRLDRLSDPYGMWIAEIEEKGQSEKSYIKVPDGGADNTEDKKKICITDCGDSWMITTGAGYAGMPYGRYEDYFSGHPDCALIYADEDMVDESRGDKGRFGPFMKPDYSPDTLLSFFYMGSQVFVQKEHFEKAFAMYCEALRDGKIGFAEWNVDLALIQGGLKTKAQMDRLICDRRSLYELILYFTEYISGHDLTVAHIPQILFHGSGSSWQAEDPKRPEAVNPNAYWGYTEEYDSCKINAMARRGILGKLVEHGGYSRPVFDVTGDHLISIVIPSKDHVDVLATCLRSIYDKTQGVRYEIIVVDNGSNDDNRGKIQKLQEVYPFSYLYHPMDFNFSAMCNLGVAQAKGDYILLLNDDMEILQSDWLSIMLGQALQTHVGAVGAKLLYPGTDRIQHAGITNLWVGPAHKLLKETDSVDYYYGRNRLSYDMIGVTAACLLVAKDKYEQVGGFCEDIAVSYNDVDFCFSLYDHGYYNVIRNDVVLYHHESISRGDDALSESKWNRLLHEKDFVYERHPALNGKDPFYNPGLAGFKHKYFCSYLYPYEQRLAKNEIHQFRGQIKKEWYNNCLTVTIEHIRLERRLNLTDEVDVYWIEGWAYVLGMDNARYSCQLILTDENGSRFTVTPFERYRPDVVDILPEQNGVALAGFSARLRREDLHPGSYGVSVLFRDRCSRQRLFKECEEILTV